MRDHAPTDQAEQVPQLVFQTLVDEFGESQQRKYKGFVATQSLRTLMNYIQAEQVVEVYAEADISADSEPTQGPVPPGGAKHCIQAQQQTKTWLELNYDLSKHGELPWLDIAEYLDLETTPVDDLAVRSLTIRVENEQLELQLRRVLEAAIDLGDEKYLKQPFFFTMRSRPAQNKERDAVKEHNDNEFLKRVGYRVLDLRDMYSLRAKQDKADPVMGVTPRELEDLAFNYEDGATQSFGALYSKLIINKWRAAFSRSLADTTAFRWSDEALGWRRADEVEAEA
jgi:hypothetical protein